MKIVVIFAQIRPTITERLSIAMLAFDGDIIQFRYSNAKLKIFAKLVPKYVVKFIKSYILSLNKSVYNLKEIFESEAQTSLYKQLHNNLVCFECFDIEYSIENFDKLFKKYVE